MPFLNHLPELMIVLVLGLLVFGPKRLPEIGNAVAKTIKSFQSTMKELPAAEPKEAPVALPPAKSEVTSVE